MIPLTLFLSQNPNKQTCNAVFVEVFAIQVEKVVFLMILIHICWQTVWQFLIFFSFFF